MAQILDENMETYLIHSRLKMGEQIKRIRERKGYNQEKLAEIMKISRTTISKIESGKFNFSMDYLAKFSWFLGFEISLNEKEK